MSWVEQLSGVFPNGYDGEPPHLRRDIADELADHLECAMARERRRTDDEGDAWRAVLARFGDPRRLARELWFDAMKERVMTQRVMLVTVVILAALTVAVSVFAWVSLRQAQRVNQALLTRLQAAASAPVVAGIADNLTRIRVRVVRGSSSGPPVPQADLHLYPMQQGGRAQTGPEGLATFLVPAGSYALDADLPSGYSGRVKIKDSPGGAERDVLCVAPDVPDVPFKAGTVQIRLMGVEDLTSGDFLIGLVFNPPKTARKVEGVTWRTKHRRVAPILTPDGRVVSNGAGWEKSFRYSPAETQRVAPVIGGLEGTYRLVQVRILCAESRRKADQKPQAAGMRPLYVECASRTYPPEQASVFELLGEEKNEWTIALPADLVTQAREQAKTRGL